MSAPEATGPVHLAVVTFTAHNGRRDAVVVCPEHRQRLAGALSYLRLPTHSVERLPADARTPGGRRRRCRNCKGYALGGVR